MRSLLPVAKDSLTIDEIAELYAYPGSGLVRANMVASLDGAVSADGKTKPISGAADMFMFGVLRAVADVIVVGAGTARAEGYGPGRARAEFAHLRDAAGQPPAPTVAIVTRSANLDPDSTIFTEALTRTVIITCASAPAENRSALAAVADIQVCGDAAVDLTAAVAALRERGLKRMLTEGGPTLLGDLTKAGLVDELALSVSPVIAGGKAGRILTTADPALHQMTMKSLLEQDGFLFGLYERADTTR